MFNGIIEHVPRVVAAAASSGGPMRLSIEDVWGDLTHGESVAINGACLTVAAMGDRVAHFDVVAETLSKTNLGALSAGDRVHAERSMRVGDRISGHFVQGHVDGQARIVERRDDPADWRLVLEAPHDLVDYLVPKGSVTLDGVSLTIAATDGSRFEVALVPTTLDKTLLGKRAIGWRCNLEADILAKTVVEYARRVGTGARD